MNDKNKKRNFIIVFGLLTLSFLLVFGGYISRNIFRQDYPLVFIDKNNRLMYITKSLNDKNDIVSHIESTSIVYGNNNTKMILYTNNKALYLLDTQVGGEGTKIVDETKDYGFSLDDKYVYYIYLIGVIVNILK